MPLRLALALLFVFVWGAARAEDAGPIDQRVAEALKSLPSPYGLHQLQEIVDQAEPKQRLEVISIIETQRRVDARPVVVALISSQDPVIAQRALEAMALLGAGSTAEHDAVDAALLNGQERVRRAAIACIVAWRDIRHVPALVATLRGGTERLREEASDALTQLTDQHFGQDPKAWTDWYQKRQAATQERFDKLRERLRSENGQVVADTIASLAEITDRRADTIELLKPLLKDEDQRVAGAAYAALKAIAPQELVGVDEIKVPAAPRVAAPPKPAPPAPKGGFPWGATLGALVILGIGAWWVRRLMAGTRAPSVAEVVARAQREAGIDSERSAPVVRAPARPAPVVTGVRADAAAKIAAAKAASTKGASAKSGVKKPSAGKAGEKIFELD